MLRSKVLLRCSLALNVVLGAALVVWFKTSPGAVQLRLGTEGPEAGTGSPIANDPTQLVNKAISAGIPSRLAYQLALLSARPVPASHPEREYWRSPVERMRRQRALAADADATVRRVLLRSFGPSARERPEFAPAFNPHADGLDFLSSDKRAALNDILASPSSAGTGQVGSASGPCAVGACGEVASRIKELLTPAEYFEYQLRESALAAHLSSSGADFSEQEFRSAFRILSDAGATPVSIKESLLDPAVKSQLAGVLGKERLLKLERTQDPRAEELVLTATRAAVPRLSLGPGLRVPPIGAAPTAASR